VHQVRRQWQTQHALSQGYGQRLREDLPLQLLVHVGRLALRCLILIKINKLFHGVHWGDKRQESTEKGC